MSAKSLADAISQYGARLKPKFSSAAISGAPEDQLRGPLETLLHDLAELAGLPPKAINLVGETTLSDIKTRPDYAVTNNNALIGFIEIKAPGKGADPRKFTDPHDKEQWGKLKALPNLIYSDGNSFSLWRDGEVAGKVVQLDGDVETSGAKLAAPDTLLPLISDFLRWKPDPPKSAKGLAQVSARLCRLLRDQVIEQMALGNPGLTALAADWRKLLFPNADNAQFADGYAQAVTFGLLVARAGDVPIAGGIDKAAQELRKTNSLIGTALRLLTDDTNTQLALKTSLGTLTRVLSEVNWHTISKDKPEAWLYFYEDFLDVYDNKLRKSTGSYYTPPEVVDAMVRLADEALRGPLFDQPMGFASKDVTVADPAVGTGTFLLGVLRKIAKTIEDDQGAGAVRGAIAEAAKRLIGFELQFGPFAVAQLRVIAEMQALMATAATPMPEIPELRLFITNTLENPFVEEETLGQVYEPIAVSRRAANKIKKEERITVVIGNPPYKNRAAGLGGWIEGGSSGRPAPMDYWDPPPEWSLGAQAHHLKNLYIYFWRWATLKVFGSGWVDATGDVEADRYGIVCFITVAGFLNGPGFQKMREDLRRECSDIWVIDCSPEGHQPEVLTRIFEGVQQPICIVLAARSENEGLETPARLKFLALKEGRRQDKFAELANLSLNSSAWKEGANGWRDPFLPAQVGAWPTFPALAQLFSWSGPGVKTHRTWVIAPDVESLERRWDALRKESDHAAKENLFHADRDRYIDKVVKIDLGSHTTREMTVAQDNQSVVQPDRYAFRTLDRQWIVPDHRLLSMARPELWSIASNRQLFLTAPEDVSPTSGPPVTFACFIPDMHHYHGRGGRVYPLWKDSGASPSNIKPTLLAYLAKIYGRPVSAEDMLAYLAATMAHSAFTSRFAADLVRPGLHVPLTADAKLFTQAVALGSEVIWLHCYGERFADPKADRPKQAPRLPKGSAPSIPADGEIPPAPAPLPDTMDYDAATQRLRIGQGYVANVTPQMWSYEVSGKNVLRQWFSYRKLDRTRPVIGDRRPPSPLDKIQAEGWLAEYTTDLLDLLNVLGRLTLLEPAQASLLERICDGLLITADQLSEAGALASPAPGATPSAKGKPKKKVVS